MVKYLGVNKDLESIISSLAISKACEEIDTETFQDIAERYKFASAKRYQRRPKHKHKRNKRHE